MSTMDEIFEAGIPAVTYVRVQQNGSGERGAISVQDPTLLHVFDASSGKFSEHGGFAHVFDRHIEDEDVLHSIIGNDASMNPMDAFVGDGATVVLLVAGSSITKKHDFNRRRLLPFIAQELFAMIRDKRYRAERAAGGYDSAIKFKAFGIQDEVISDLIRPGYSGLTIKATPEEGIQVSALIGTLVESEEKLIEAIHVSCDGRMSITPPPGGSIDTSSAVWEFELSQDEGLPGQKTRHHRSKFIVAEIPSTDPLVLGASQLRQLESPTLHKSLVTFADVAQKLKSPSQSAIAPFRSSKLTHFLSELLGGNALVLSLAHIAPGEAANTRKTLEIASDLSKSKHFPITSYDLTEVLRGLLSKYRSLILQLQDEIINGAPIGSEAPMLTEVRFQKLQSELAEARAQKNLAKTDYVRLYEMLQMLKEKYNGLIQQKAEQSEELVKAEEEKLKVARALVELKLEHTKLHEISKTAQYELNTQIVSKDQIIGDLQDEVKQATIKAEDERREREEVERKIKSEQIELVALQERLKALSVELEKEQEKSVETKLEFTLLRNEKEEVEKEKKKLEENLSATNYRLQETSTNLNGSEKENERLLSDNRQWESECMELKRINTDLDIGNKRISNELETRIAEHESVQAEFQKKSDNIYEEARVHFQEDIRKAESFSEQLIKEIKAEEKRSKDLMRRIFRLETDLEKSAKHQQTLQAEADEVRTMYRQKLLEVFNNPTTTAVLEEEMENNADDVPVQTDDKDAEENTSDSIKETTNEAEVEGEAGESRKKSAFNLGHMKDVAKALKENEGKNENEVENTDSKKEDSNGKDDDVKQVEKNGDVNEDDGNPNKENESNENIDANAEANEGDANKENNKENDNSNDNIDDENRADTNTDPGDTKDEISSNKGSNKAENDGTEKTEGEVVEVSTSEEEKEKVKEKDQEEETRKIMEELTASYSEKENKLNTYLEGEEQELRAITKAYRALYDFYDNLYAFTIENATPGTFPPKPTFDDEFDLLRQMGGSGDLDEAEKQAAKKVERLQVSEKALLDDNSKVSKALDMYKARVERLDSSISVLKEENDNLKGQLNGSSYQEKIDELQKKFEDQLKLQANAMLSQFTSGKLMPAMPAATVHELTPEELEAKRKSEEEERARKEDEMTKNKEEQRNKYTDRIDELKKENNAKDEEIRIMSEELNALKVEKEKAAALEQQLMTAREGDETGEISSTRYNSLLSRYKTVQGEKISLTSRVTSLEDELKQYNQYMRDSAMMYRRDRATLRDAIKKHLTTLADNKDTIESLHEEIAKLKNEVESGKEQLAALDGSSGNNADIISGVDLIDADVPSLNPDVKSEIVSETDEKNEDEGQGPQGDGKEEGEVGDGKGGEGDAVEEEEDEIPPELTNSLDNLNGPASARKNSRDSAQALINATFEAGSPRKSDDVPNDTTDTDNAPNNIVDAEGGKVEE